jgi:hypothetical protein
MKHSSLLAAIILFIRIFIILKLLLLFLQTSLYPEKYDVSSLTWWIYLLIFDIWILTQIPAPEKTTEETKED